MDDLAEYESEFAFLEEKLRPIGNRPVTSLADFHKKWIPPLDEAEVRPQATSLLERLTETYVRIAAAREPVRNLFKKYPTTSWAMAPSFEPTDEGKFYSRIVLISMKDQDRDGRDTLVELWETCYRAAAAGVNIVPLLESVAAISSEENRYGLGSMRSMLLEAPDRYMSGRPIWEARELPRNG